MKDEAARSLAAPHNAFYSAPTHSVHTQHPAPSTYLPPLRRQVYGERSDRHQEIMMMDADALHDAHPFTEDLVFNEASPNHRPNPN